MTWLSNSALDHLRAVADLPDLSGTRYELRDKIGQGGAGAVYAAWDTVLERDVALKVAPLPEPSAATIGRMLGEARILAGLEHPGVVPVHDAGILPDGRTFYVMKLVRGRRLDADLQPAVSLSDRLRILERICEAVAFAHAHGVVHRDLKPANIMVGPFGEVLVMDWGISTILGTPGYMAPEQARGDLDAVDARTDVYALGALLRFLFAGEASPPRPLEAIAAKALAPEPSDRYVSVQELAADISRYLEGMSVLAYPEGWIERVVRVGRKYRTAILLVAAYLVMRILLLMFPRI